jgi:hypothetical protein
MMLARIATLIPLKWLYVALGLALAGCLVYTYQWTWKTAVEVTEAKYAKASAEAKQKAEESYQQALGHLKLALENQRAEREKLEQELRVDAEEARKDPNANRTALGAPSVRRLNKVH